jgi:hypothetical protein
MIQRSIALFPRSSLPGAGEGCHHHAVPIAVRLHPHYAHTIAATSLSATFFLPGLLERFQQLDGPHRRTVARLPVLRGRLLVADAEQEGLAAADGAGFGGAELRRRGVVAGLSARRRGGDLGRHRTAAIRAS